MMIVASLSLFMMTPGALAAPDMVESAIYEAALDPQSEQLRQQDPSTLINAGIARAQHGDTAVARKLFTAAYQNNVRYDLETADGKWVDSRILAARALKMLDRGEFRAGDRVASR